MGHVKTVFAVEKLDPVVQRSATTCAPPRDFPERCDA